MRKRPGMGIPSRSQKRCQCATDICILRIDALGVKHFC